jgi:hypothetical protein
MSKKIVLDKFFKKMLSYPYGAFPDTVMLCGAPALPANMLTLVFTPESSDVNVPLLN